MLNKKLKKLIRDPNLFFSDMVLKQKKKYAHIYTKKVTGHYQYTVVSAVYNVGRYLDDYFKSFVNQRLDFKKHIQLILVDDGSTDNSAQIIKKWQEKYPNNIKYIWKQNGGQASARNVGLKNVNTDWVTFIDSDDFVSPDYFYLVDEQIYSDPKIKLVCCNQIYFFEENNQYIDRHPLNYRFKKEKKILPAEDLGSFMQFSAPLSFFHVPSISKDLSFDEMLKLTFEDGKFVAKYLLSLNNSKVCFYAKPKYFNRKRQDKSSTMDNAWLNKGQFGVVLEKGYLEILKEYQDALIKIPVFMQRTILWELLRLVKHLVDKENNVAFLNSYEKQNFLKLMDRTFSYIDNEVILGFELGSCGFSRQVGMLGCFKGVKPPKQVVYIDKYDDSKNEILLRYFTNENIEEEFYIDGKEIYPTYIKESCRYFLDRVFLVERRLWLPVTNGRFTIKLDRKNVNINYFGKRFRDNVSLDLNSFSKYKCNENIWLFMDRDDSARDNAEFLYEYVQKNYSIQCYFVLGTQSPDWHRLSEKGFNLIAHASPQHKEILEHSSLLISSQIGSILNPFENIKTHYKTIFLQHGVTKDDISGWINNCQIDLMITATKSEHESIVNNTSRYIYGDKEIKLTGFPRFDSLTQADCIKSKQILIMFTWRKNISGNFVSNTSSERLFNNEFVDSEYYQRINALISSKELSTYAKDNNLSIIFCPHPNIRPYVELFKVSDNISISEKEDCIHELIKTSSMLITDYSSIAFDFAYMHKPVCYYQFDEDDFFSGAHTYTQGYYEYRKNGFGPVVKDEESLLNCIKNNFINDFVFEDKYQKRANEIFVYNDADNCKRVFEAISQFINNKPSPIDNDIIAHSAEVSYSNRHWDKAAERWRLVLDLEKYENKEDAALKMIISLRESGNLDCAFLEYNNNLYNSIYFNIEKSNLLSCYCRWDEAIQAWPEKHYDFSDRRSFIIYCLSNYHLDNLNLLEGYIINSLVIKDNILQVIIRSLCESLKGNHSFGICLLRELMLPLEQSVIIECRLELILANLLIRDNNFSEAQEMLEKYETHSRTDPYRRGIIITLAAHYQQWSKVVKQIDSLTIDLTCLSNVLISTYLKSKRLIGEHENSLNLSMSLIANYSHDYLIINEHLENLIANKSFAMAEALLIECDKNKKLLYRLAYVLRMQGKLIEALEIISADDAMDPESFDDWITKVEILELAGEWSSAASCWTSIMRKYPEIAKDKYANNFYNSQIISKLH